MICNVSECLVVYLLLYEMYIYICMTWVRVVCIAVHFYRLYAELTTCLWLHMLSFIILMGPRLYELCRYAVTCMYETNFSHWRRTKANLTIGKIYWSTNQQTINRTLERAFQHFNSHIFKHGALFSCLCDPGEKEMQSDTTTSVRGLDFNKILYKLTETCKAAVASAGSLCQLALRQTINFTIWRDCSG